MDKKMVATNIEWDLDDIEDEAEKDAINENVLPSEVEIPANVAGKNYDVITDYLSDTYGYCVKGYTLAWKDPKADAIPTQSSLDVTKMRQRLYELYQLDWMQRHGFSVQDIINGMADIQDCDLSNLDEDDSVGLEDIDRVDDMYSEFVNDCGFGGGSMWVCYDEFIGSEYREQDYIKELCDVVPDGTELYDLYLHDIKG